MKRSTLFQCLLATALLASAGTSHGQTVTLSLTDSMLSEPKVSYTGRNVVDTITLDEYKQPVQIMRLSPSNFFWSGQFSDEDYHPMDYGLVEDDSALLVLTRNNVDSTFITENLVVGGEYILRFIPINKKRGDTLFVSFKVELCNDLLCFYPTQTLVGSLPINDTIVRFEIWPFQTGPFARVMDESSTTRYDRYKMNEPFPLDGFVVSFKNFDFVRKSIQVEITELDDETTLYGYKVGRTVEGWDREQSIWDSLGVERDAPLIIYFGGSWCPPCLEELPRLKNIASACVKNGISVVSAAALYKDTRDEALDYLEENEFPGTYYITSLYDPNSLIKLLDIAAYPTYVFISSKGEVLFRAENKSQRDRELNAFFSQFVTELRK